jgi:hypothetical protein
LTQRAIVPSSMVSLRRGMVSSSAIVVSSAWKGGAPRRPLEAALP